MCCISGIDVNVAATLLHAFPFESTKNIPHVAPSLSRKGYNSYVSLVGFECDLLGQLYKTALRGRTNKRKALLVAACEKQEALGAKLSRTLSS